MVFAGPFPIGSLQAFEVRVSGQQGTDLTIRAQTLGGFTDPVAGNGIVDRTLP